MGGGTPAATKQPERMWAVVHVPFAHTREHLAWIELSAKKIH